jgi:hypothetical protein
MDTAIAQSVAKIFQEAEVSLRALIGKAAETQKYDDIVVLVHLARQLQELSTRSSATPKGISSASISRGPEADAPPSTKRTQKVRGTAGSSQPKQYPVFSTTDERLIKLGWSKKNRTEYEHRAPKPSVAIVHEAIRTIGATGKPFEVEALSPLVTADNQEIPGYQIYMAIGWLRDLGAIQKGGRNRYRLTNSGFDAFDTYWNRSLSGQ